MRSLRFLTWLDIRRVVRRKTAYGRNLPSGITNISCFSDALEISLAQTSDKKSAISHLKDWFGDWYQDEEDFVQLDLDSSIVPKASIQLDLDNSVLPIEFTVDTFDREDQLPLRPFWEEVAYLDEETSKSIPLPTPYQEAPSLLAFYSFKGGVGRTLHVAAHLFALLERAKEVHKPINILIIDADLEAPGLTYWDRKEKQQPTVSFIDFLETYHYSQLSTEQTLESFAAEVKKTPQYYGESIFYFLPACLRDDQLLETPVLPEHLARSPESVWTFSNAIHQLGAALKVDYVIVDLRAGLSEISSPLIFDPRVQRFFITTAAEQSVEGLSLVLEQISRVAPSEAEIDSDQYFDPLVIISFLTPELQSLPAFDDALTKFRISYAQSTDSDDSSLYSKRLEIGETDFSQELLYINTWEEARLKLASTSIMKVAESWAESQLRAEANGQDSDSTLKYSPQQPLESVRAFRDICQRYEFAESGAGQSLLITETLKNLATNFRDTLPRIVSLGAKGAGKTFIYVQLSRLKYWESFLNIALRGTEEPNAYIFPLLQSKNLQDTAKEIVLAAREEVRKALGDGNHSFLHSAHEERIQIALEEDLTDLKWSKFWVREIAISLGMNPTDSEEINLQGINSFLIGKKVRIVFLFDGLEDIFEGAASNESQKRALKALISLPDKLSEIRKPSFGLIVLLRRDFLRYAITQNSAQFERLYSPYDLSWDVDSFLKLVYWVCSQANVIGAREDEIERLGREDLVSELQKLWGEKLGGLREARTASWVFAALTDFTGRLQARDIVRLLFHAADITVDRAQEVQFERWSSNRLLPPQAIRRSLQPCSEKKVNEAMEEYPAFRDWVVKVRNEYTPGQKRIPFVAEDLNLDQVTIRMLEEMGVIYEDSAKDGIARYYMPEIFRAGLDFSLEKGSRPRVLVLKRKAFGIGTL